jgi:methionyl-tRNA formyltransferase
MLRILFAGTPLLAKNILQQLLETKYQVIACFTQPDKPAGRGQKLSASPVKQFALGNNIPIYQSEILTDPKMQFLIEELKPDVAIVVAYGLIIPKQLLTIPKYGFINVHMSLLPRWRGAAPIQHAILAGDQETGITIMQMDSKLDTGDILAASSLAITKQDTSDTLQTKMCTLGSIELINVLTHITTGSICSIKQDHNKATYAHKINKQDAKIDWKQPTEIIHRKIRAYNPWPVAFTYSENTAIRIWDAIAVANNHNAHPGSILAVNKQSVDVATIDGCISLQKVQLPNKKPLLIEEIIKANKHPFIVGNILQ